MPDVDEDHDQEPVDAPPLTLEEAKGLKGIRLVGSDGSLAGRIGGVLVDAEDGTPTWFVIRHARSWRRTAVPAVLAAPGVGRVWVPLSRELVQAAAQVDSTEGLSSMAELELLEHYGFPADDERVARLRERGDDATGSIPPG